MTAEERRKFLTQLVTSGGWGSKLGPLDLRAALEGLPRTTDERFLFGGSPGDDAALFRLTPEIALVQTVDFFTPIVDDPYDFGVIAAANSLSDCYALGATPITALNIVTFPITEGADTLKEILRGGAETVARAGAVIVGGHSVSDKEPKYGLAVTGIVHPDKAILNTGARPGDALVLTKRLGIETIMNLAKKGALSEPDVLVQAVASMKTLNKDAAALAIAHGAHACTDVTGFGLLGHAHNLATASKVALKIRSSAVPRFGDDVLWSQATPGGGSKRNLAWLKDHLKVDAALSGQIPLHLIDAQTSGPLLMAVPASVADKICQDLKKVPPFIGEIVGEVVEGPAGTIELLA